MNKQDNGNTQLNQIREELNDRTHRKKFLGNTQEYIGIPQEDLEQFKITINGQEEILLLSDDLRMIIWYRYCFQRNL